MFKSLRTMTKLAIKEARDLNTLIDEAASKELIKVSHTIDPEVIKEAQSVREMLRQMR